MPLPNQSIVAVIGSPSFDVYPQFGEVGEGHFPGLKINMRPGDQERFEYFSRNGAGKHPGGNGFNFLAGIAAEREYEDRSNIRFLSVRAPDHDRASMMIGMALTAMGVDDRSAIVDGYTVSASIIERQKLGSNRMVLGRRRDRMGPHLSDEAIHNTVDDADFVALASPKDFDLMERVFGIVNPNKFFSVNPGSEDFGDPERLRSVLSSRMPDVLALNEDEMEALHHHKTSIFSDRGRKIIDLDMARGLAQQTCEDGLTKNVFLTLGEAGMILCGNGNTYISAAANVPQHLVVDNLGAGDRGHKEVAVGMFNNNRQPAAHILHLAAIGIESLLVAEGAHGDLEEILYRQSLVYPS